MSHHACSMQVQILINAYKRHMWSSAGCARRTGFESRMFIKAWEKRCCCFRPIRGWTRDRLVLRKPWTVLQAVTGLCLSWGDVRFLKHLSSLDAMGLEVLTMLRRHLQVQKQYPSLAQKHFNGSEHTSDVLHTCCLLFVPLKASRQNHYLLWM